MPGRNYGDGVLYRDAIYFTTLAPKLRSFFKLHILYPIRMQQLHIASIQLFTQLDENVTLSTVNVLKEYGKIIFLIFISAVLCPENLRLFSW